MGNRLLALEKKLSGAGLGPKASIAKSVGLSYWSQPMGYAYKDGMHRMELTDNAGKPSRSRWVENGVESAKATTFKAKLIERKKAAYNASKSNLDLFKANIYAIVDTLEVESTRMYQPTETSTYCNVYAYDVVTGLGGYLPRMWWTNSVEKKMISGALTPDTIHEKVKGKPAYKDIYDEGVSLEQRANMLNAWLDRIGSTYFGWEKATDMVAAQTAANNGHIVIISARNKDSKRSGHINIILPELPDSPAAKDNLPLQSQAGRTNFAISRSKKWWNDSSHENGNAWIYKGEIKSPIIASGVALGGAYA